MSFTPYTPPTLLHIIIHALYLLSYMQKSGCQWLIHYDLPSSIFPIYTFVETTNCTSKSSYSPYQCFLQKTCTHIASNAIIKTSIFHCTLSTSCVDMQHVFIHKMIRFVVNEAKYSCNTCSNACQCN